MLSFLGVANLLVMGGLWYQIRSWRSGDFAQVARHEAAAVMRSADERTKALWSRLEDFDRATSEVLDRVGQAKNRVRFLDADRANLSREFEQLVRDVASARKDVEALGTDQRRRQIEVVNMLNGLSPDSKSLIAKIDGLETQLAEFRANELKVVTLTCYVFSALHRDTPPGGDLPLGHKMPKKPGHGVLFLDGESGIAVLDMDWVQENFRVKIKKVVDVWFDNGLPSRGYAGFFSQGDVDVRYSGSTPPKDGGDLFVVHILYK
ncbi:hypothetical protein ACYOEI_18290 [Singulisphaera rosea]